MVYRKGSYREADVSFGLFEVLCYWTSACMAHDIFLIWLNQDTEPCQKYFRVCQDQRNANSSRYTSNRRRRWNRGCFYKIKHFDQSVLCFSWADKESRILFDIVNNNQKQKYEKQIDTNNWIKKWIVMYYRRYLKY
jgi:hypothetical protein